MILKKTIKKWVAGMMLPVTALGAVTGVLAKDYTINSSLVSAVDIEYYATVNGNVVKQFPIYIFRRDTTEYTNGDSSKIEYKLVKTISSIDDIGTGVSYSYFYDDWTLYGFTTTSDYGWSYTNDQSTVTSWGNVSIKRMISDSTAPALETQVFLTDVDSPITLEYILQNVKFVDEVDGDIAVTSSNVVEDNYSANKNKVGKWTIKLQATDKAGNTGTGTIEVWVQDKTNPIISGPSTFTSNISSPLTEAAIRAQLSANDNVDGDISDQIELVSDEFTGNDTVPGTYTIKYQVADSATNVSVVYPVTVTVVDDVKPVFSVVEGYSQTYTTSYRNKIEMSTILAGIKVTDNVDGTLKPEVIENKYEGNDTIPGTYTIKFRATDKAGNVSEVFTVTIEVTDKIPPVFYANGLFIGVSTAQQLTHQELVNLLIYMEGQQDTGTGVSLLSTGGYSFDSANAPGVYTLSYCMVAEDGTQGEVQTASIKVLGEEQITETDEKEQVEQRVNKFSEKIKNAFKNIGEFFVKIFKSIAWIFTLGKVDPKWDEWY